MSNYISIKWDRYLCESQEENENHRYADLLVEAVVTDNEDLFFENVIHLNESILDAVLTKLGQVFFKIPQEKIAALITKIAEWVISAFEWAAEKVPDEWGGLKGVANKIRDFVKGAMGQLGSPRTSMYIAATLIKMVYVGLLLKVVGTILIAKGGAALGGKAAAAAAKAVANGNGAIEALNTAAQTSDPGSAMKIATTAVEKAFAALKGLEGAKILGFSSGKLSPRRGIVVLGKQLFTGDSSLSAKDTLTGLIAEYKIYRQSVWQ
tara:strand:- start:542 stop:1336 length:795 start_codon:yes stop_codon:yes gene_type:complete